MASDAVVVAVYRTHDDAEEAVKALLSAGLDPSKLSSAGKGADTEEHAVGHHSTGDWMLHWGRLGVFWGTIGGLLLGSAFFVIPGIGPLVAAGPLASAVVGAVEGTVAFGGLGALAAGLFSTGVPPESAVKYEAAIKADQFLLTSHGSPDEAQKAQEVLERTNHAGLDLHAP